MAVVVDGVEGAKYLRIGSRMFDSGNRAFAWSADVNRSFERLVGGFIVALTHWVDAAAPHPTSSTTSTTT